MGIENALVSSMPRTVEKTQKSNDCTPRDGFEAEEGMTVLSSGSGTWMEDQLSYMYTLKAQPIFESEAELALFFSTGETLCCLDGGRSSNLALPADTFLACPLPPMDTDFARCT